MQQKDSLFHQFCIFKGLNEKIFSLETNQKGCQKFLKIIQIFELHLNIWNSAVYYIFIYTYIYFYVPSQS